MHTYNNTDNLFLKIFRKLKSFAIYKKIGEEIIFCNFISLLIVYIILFLFDWKFFIFTISNWFFSKWNFNVCTVHVCIHTHLLSHRFHQIFSGILGYQVTDDITHPFVRVFWRFTSIIAILVVSWHADVLSKVWRCTDNSISSKTAHSEASPGTNCSHANNPISMYAACNYSACINV